VEPEGQDEFVTMYGTYGEQYEYRKSIDAIKLCDHEIKNIKVDFGLIDDYGIIRKQGIYSNLLLTLVSG
jgi:hypothetical protein